ncbi:serine/threonine protein kinase, partial [Streptomyces sp. NTH33]|uniref:PASTA domain-containing protein n=1 Tax=Streptomyces sp. NTH33 TaxID=1735453 RepID=UPI000DB4D1B8
VQTPYQPAPAPNPYSTGAPAPSQGYGYPQQAGYQTPTMSPYAQPAQAPTSPPYTVQVQHTPGPGGGRSNKPVIIGSAAVALIAVVGLIAALALNDGGGDNGAGGGDSTITASPSVVAGHRGPDKSKTINADECREPRKSYDDPAKVRVPDFRYKNLDSVKECLQAANWKLKKNDYDENTFGQDTVINQFPAPGTDIDPKNAPDIQLDVSTGNPQT